MSAAPTYLTPRRQDRTLEGRRILDLAEGILVGLRRYPPEAAFAELIDVARRHNVSAFAAAAALVRLASTIGDTDDAQQNVAPMLVPPGEWSDLLTRALAQPHHASPTDRSTEMRGV